MNDSHPGSRSFYRKEVIPMGITNPLRETEVQPDTPAPPVYEPATEPAPAPEKVPSDALA